MSLVIGLLGGIGSGKSVVAGLLAERGCTVLDADAEARAVVALPKVRAALAARFGADIFDADGNLDRARLAARAFQDSRATTDLNALVHPEVRARLGAALDDAGRLGRDAVLDVPLLLESPPLSARVTHWLYVDAPEAARDAQVAGRGWSPEERRRREARQAALSDKRARADAILENFGAIEDLGPRVDALLSRWRST